MLQERDLWSLLSQHGLGLTLGFPDPMRGLLAANIVASRAEALASLQERRLVILDADGGVAIESTLAAQVETVARATHTVLVLEQPDVATARSYHYGPQGIVSLEADGGGAWRIGTIAGREGVVARVLAPLLSQVFFTGDELCVCVSRERLQTAKALHAQGQADQAAEHVACAGMPADDAAQLVFDLESPRLHLDIAIFRDRDDPNRTKTSGLVVLGGQTSLWLLELGDDAGQSILVSRVSKATLEQRLAALLP